MPSWSFTGRERHGACPGQTAGDRVTCSGRGSPGSGTWRLKPNSVPPHSPSPGISISVQGVTRLSISRPWSYLWLSSLSVLSCCQSYRLQHICNISLNDFPFLFPLGTTLVHSFMTCHLDYCRSPTYSYHFVLPAAWLLSCFYWVQKAWMGSHGLY